MIIQYQRGIVPMYNFSTWVLALSSYCPLLLKNHIFFSVRCPISVTHGQISMKLAMSIQYQRGIVPMYNFSTWVVALRSYCPLLLKNHIFFSVQCHISETDGQISMKLAMSIKY